MPFCVADNPVAGLTVNPNPSAPAHICGDRKTGPLGLLRHGTMGGRPGVVMRAVTMACCAFLGSDGKNGFEVASGLGPAKMELCVSKGTAFWESCRRPSKAPYKYV